MRREEVLKKYFAMSMVMMTEEGSNFKREVDETKGLSLRPAIFDDEKFIKKYNIRMSDEYLQVYYDDVKVSDTLYRKGGMFDRKFKEAKYFPIIKYYPSLIKDYGSKNPKAMKPHLAHCHIIMDSKGVEKVNELDEYNGLDYPNIIHPQGIIFNIKEKYFNIETKEFYCKSYSSMKSSKFLFLDNAYGDNKSKKGVWKINLFDGTYEIFTKE